MSQIPTPVAPVDSLAPDPRITELQELEATYPPPALDEVIAEWKWIHAEMAKGTLGEDTPYWNRWLAVYQHRVIGADYEPLGLRIAKSRELGIHPERMILTYNGEI